ncbi:MAG: VOC family protein [Rhodospirillales bacterium]|nr:VOC family protein [Rhodospirillales bacterium]
MPLDEMDHFSIRTIKLEECKEFYETVLGMSVGDRPPLDFPGYWMYVGKMAVVHLVGIDEDDPSGLIEYLGDVDLDDLDGGGAVDHLAFRASDVDELKSRLEKLKIPYRERMVPEMNLQQVFLEDPNNITIELNYYD